MARPIPDELRAFREVARERHFPRPYSGWLHFAWANGVGLGVVIVALLNVTDIDRIEWITVPLSFLFANVVEHRVHRGPMHHRRSLRPLAALYERHTLSHHKFYTHEAMAAPTSRDFYMVLFPPWAVVAMVVLVCPIAGVLGVTFGVDVACLFLATGLGYFVLYEWLHLAYHLDPDGFVGRLPGMAVLRRHHTLHHDPRRMGRYNFNVTFPIADWLHGTLYRGESEVRS